MRVTGNVVRRGALLFCLAVLSAGCGGNNREEKALAGLSRDFFEYYFKSNPVMATWVGEHRYDAMLDDVSEDAQEKLAGNYRDYLERLRRIDKGRLALASRVDAEYLEDSIELLLVYFEDVRWLETNPAAYSELLANSIFNVLSREYAPLEKRLDLIASRLEQFPRVVEAAQENLANPPKLFTEIAIEQTAGTISFLENELRREAEPLPIQSERIQKALDPALEALRVYEDYLKNDLVNRSFGDMRLGESLYRKALRLTLGTDMPSEEIVALAYEELERVHERMYALAAPLYEEMTGERVAPEPDAGTRRAIVALVLDRIADDHAKPQGLLDACTAAYAEAEAFVREKRILTVPLEPFAIIWALPFHQATQVAASLMPGPLDRNMKYYFVVSPVPAYMDHLQAERYMREYNNEMIRIITIHEAMPGHFVQAAYGNRNPAIVRSVFPSPAFSEGWAVYCQGMMAEEGFRGGDSKFKLVCDKYYLRVVTNAILDSGMHRENMREKEAVQLITEEAFQDESEALTKWRRRMGYLPCYTSSYFVGSRDIWMLRREAEDRQGVRFNLGDFHERLLSQGSIPVKYARELLLQE